MILFTTYFEPNDKERRNELQLAINKNLNNNKITKIVILNEKDADLSFLSDTSKVEVIKTNKRPKFSGFIKEVNARANSNSISIIANTDIYFGESLIYANEFLNTKTAIALSRYDLIDINKLKYYKKWDSQDAWLFKGKIYGIEGNYFMGEPGCDNKFAFQLLSAGYKVIDASLDIVSIHIHNSEFRGYNLYNKDIKIEKPFLHLSPSKPLIRNNADLSSRCSFWKRILIYRQLKYDFYKLKSFRQDIIFNIPRKKSFLYKLLYFDYLRIKDRSTYFKME